MSSWHFNTLLNDTADLHISYTLSYNGMFTCMLGYGMFLVRRPRLFIDLLRCRSHQLSSVQRLSSTLIPVKELHKDTQRMFMMISVGDSAGFGSVCPGFNERCDVFRPVWGSARVREWRLQIYCDLWRVWSSHVVFICRHLIFLCCVMGMVFSYEVDLNMLFYIHLLSFDSFFCWTWFVDCNALLCLIHSVVLRRVRWDVQWTHRDEPVLESHTRLIKMSVHWDSMNRIYLHVKGFHSYCICLYICYFIYNI